MRLKIELILSVTLLDPLSQKTLVTFNLTCLLTASTNLLEAKQIEERKKLKKKHLVWPSSTRHGNLRNINIIWVISAAIATGRNSDEESEELSREEKMGIVGPSLLLTQPNFNFIKNIPCEYMHSVCLGVVKRLLQLTFSQ